MSPVLVNLLGDQTEEIELVVGGQAAAFPAHICVNLATAVVTHYPTRHPIASYLPNSHKYSTNDITAPSKPCTFGFVDSIT